MFLNDHVESEEHHFLEMPKSWLFCADQVTVSCTDDVDLHGLYEENDLDECGGVIGKIGGITGIREGWKGFPVILPYYSFPLSAPYIPLSFS